ncbi:divalent metal cation transporter [Candidatus Roizmanbacteria bacterium]|nr:divalent metal cation transporter [Candidatus Roizmanbacteria bacterium]
MNKLTIYLARFAPVLSVFGPATIAAIADNDAAGVATYSLAGAQFGYSILFVLFLTTLLLGLTQEMGARIGLVSGKGLGDLIRERYGIRWSVLVFGCLMIANMGTILADFAALKSVSSLFHFPAVPLIIATIIIAFLFVSRGNYKINQKLFLFGTFLYFAYVFSAFKSSPNWALAFKSVFIPTDIHFSPQFLIGSIAVLGTTITPWGQFFIQSFVIDKKSSVEKIKFTQIETYFGAFLTNFFSFFMIVATAATLHAHNIILFSGEQAAIAIRPFAGDLAALLFGIGLLNAAFMGIVIIALSTAYAFSEFFGFEGSLDVPFERGKLFYGIFLFQLIICGVIVILPSISLFKIVFYTQSLNGLLLPIIFFFLLKIANDKELMGKFKNKKWYNYAAVFATIIIILASSFAIVSSFIPNP